MEAYGLCRSPFTCSSELIGLYIASENVVKFYEMASFIHINYFQKFIIIYLFNHFFVQNGDVDEHDVDD